MRATKYTLTIKIEVLSSLVIPGMLNTVMEQFDHGNISGEHIAEDGDTLKWETEEDQVEF